VTVWTDAQAWEARWWGTEPCERWAKEIEKQRVYADLLGMPRDMDFGQARILDVGCGPVSMLLRSKHGPSVGVDPLPMSDDRLALYSLAGVEVLPIRAEDIDLTGFDEAWCYNCLQHTEDPAAILRNMARAAHTVRLFEWIYTGAGEGHPQTITPELVLAAFGNSAIWRRKTVSIGLLTGGWYIALHVERIT
jgi:SAM-dependent methyltransferase